jgi:hypothetical protein
MRRRDFITFLGGTTAWVATARGEEPRHVIGSLSALSDARFLVDLAAFYQGLKETGFVEGKNVSIEYRWADGHYDRLPSLAAELVSRSMAVIWAPDVPSAFAAKAATKTIPIVFSVGADPVKLGLVENFSRPTGNLTGMTAYFSVAGPKRVELLHELLPAVNAMAVLGNPSNENFQLDTPDIRAAAGALKLRLEVLDTIMLLIVRGNRFAMPEARRGKHSARTQASPSTASRNHGIAIGLGIAAWRIVPQDWRFGVSVIRCMGFLGHTSGAGYARRSRARHPFGETTPMHTHTGHFAGSCARPRSRGGVPVRGGATGTAPWLGSL